jgi:hypothetical protein
LTAGRGATEDLDPMTDSPEVPPDLYVALEWAAASGELAALRTLDEDALAALCDQSAAEFRDAVEAEGGPVNDATVTAGLLAELAAWLRGLAPGAYAEVARRARRGPLGERS